MPLRRAPHRPDLAYLLGTRLHSAGGTVDQRRLIFPACTSVSYTGERVTPVPLRVLLETRSISGVDVQPRISDGVPTSPPPTKQAAVDAGVNGAAASRREKWP